MSQHRSEQLHTSFPQDQYRSCAKVACREEYQRTEILPRKVIERPAPKTVKRKHCILLEKYVTNTTGCVSILASFLFLSHLHSVWFLPLTRLPDRHHGKKNFCVPTRTTLTPFSATVTTECLTVSGERTSCRKRSCALGNTLRRAKKCATCVLFSIASRTISSSMSPARSAKHRSIVSRKKGSIPARTIPATGTYASSTDASCRPWGISTIPTGTCSSVVTCKT